MFLTDTLKKKILISNWITILVLSIYKMKGQDNLQNNVVY